MFNHEEKFPAIIIQGTIAASSVLYLSHSGKPNIPIIISLISVLALFVFQASSKRFRYDFPYNRFMHIETRDVDTFILYGLTFIAFVAFTFGVLDSAFWSIIAAVFILVPGFLWANLGQKWISKRITARLISQGLKNVTKFYPPTYCEKCEQQVRIEHRVVDDKNGEEIITCSDSNCGHIKTRKVIFRTPIGF